MMAENQPGIYLLHGEDEYQISQFVAGLEAQMGEPTFASINISRLDGNQLNLDTLRSVASAAPFMAPIRLVVIERVLARLTSADQHKKFLSYLQNAPPFTLLVLIEFRALDKKEKGKENWLYHWCVTAGERVQVKKFQAPKGQALAEWIKRSVQQSGYQISNDAARELSSLMGDDTRAASLEIQKLLAYVNYSRQIELEDVQQVCISIRESQVYELLDALIAQDRRRATGLLSNVLETEDPIYLLGAFVSAFRRLILLGAMLDVGLNKGEMKKGLQVPDFVVDRMIQQRRGFSPGSLEVIYHRLLLVDESIKTGQAPPDLALELFVADWFNRTI